ncbi:MAG: sialate O-acetylesterase [Opitutaceae bacterium]
MFKFVLRSLPALVASAVAASATVSFGPLFSDHMVLQQGMAAPVWGRAEAGERITVSFRDLSVSTVTGADGRWSVLLPPLEASAAGADLVAQGANRIAVHDVVVGEVWLASGQSNMEFTVDDPNGEVYRVDRADEEVAAAQYPSIRQFKVRRQSSAAPAATAGGSWAVCSPETVRAFSAVAYFFARDLHRRLGVPVGIVDSTWGGTPVESWMDPMALASDPRFAGWAENRNAYPNLESQWRAELAKWRIGLEAAHRRGPTAYALYRHSHARPPEPAGPNPDRAGSPWRPGSLYNGMIDPLLPYAFRGVIWYQGESNTDEPEHYHALFAAMIQGWRAHIGEGNLPFFWVQLPGYAAAGDASRVSWARLREAQEQTLDLPDTGEVVTLDLGDGSNIHPRDKQEVGRRLALLAKALVYGIRVDWSGPVFDHAVREGGAVRVYFHFADAGLTAGARPLQSFELAGPDGRFYPASASITGSTVVVRSPNVPAPTAIRYAWRDAPDANLFNGAGLPAAPFRARVD